MPNRRPRSEQRQRTEMAATRLLPDEARAIEQAARSRRMSVSEFIRFCALGEVQQDAELEALRALLGSIWLYVSWRYITRQLTTEQKELWADTVEAWSQQLNAGRHPDPVVVDRWWRT